MTLFYGIIFAVLLFLFSLLLIVNSESKSTIFNDTSSAVIAKIIFLVLLVCMIYTFHVT